MGGEGDQDADVAAARTPACLLLVAEGEVRERCVAAVLGAEGVELLRLPARSPNSSAYAERFVLSTRSECLRKVIPLGAAHLRTLVREYVEHYHEARNHKGLDNVIPLPIATPVPANGTVKRRERLGAILNYYYRDAA